ncbi:MAG: hypothetical protein HQ596_04505, partial [Candidatus Saganbacteria bacterium]|nr:hypothetical protein [Candidatus Saganbacteria bacterium]
VKEGYEPKFGARPLRRAIQRLIENPLSNDIIDGTFKPGDKISADAKDGKIVFEKISETKSFSPKKEEKQEEKAQTPEQSKGPKLPPKKKAKKK